MGSTYIYKCGKCGYEAPVSGGPDAGFMVSTRTKVCPDCRRVVDVVISSRGESAKKDIGRCPGCGNRKFSPWKGHACPKCGGKMERQGGGPFCLWD